MRQIVVDRFENWRSAARKLLADHLEPRRVEWLAPAEGEALLDVTGPRGDSMSLWDSGEESEAGTLWQGVCFRVPKVFLKTARRVCCHRDEGKWALLYRVLWRLTHGEPDLLKNSHHPEVRQIQEMDRAVRRDAQRMKNRVRFRPCRGGREEHFIGWHESEHNVLRLVAPYFVQRMSVMRWTLMTPRESADWDTHVLRFGPGLEIEQPEPEELEARSRVLDAEVFHPDRSWLEPVRQQAASYTMASQGKQESEDNIGEAQEGRPAMIKRSTIKRKRESAISAADFLPSRMTLPALVKAARHCQGCDLYKRSTQTVFGEGPADAQVVFIGEQPGDQEDLAGRPFVGPAGRVLAQALDEVGIDRSLVYVTNAVKHFKWTQRGKRRLHGKPSARELAACRPWLEAELSVIQPPMIVCLGATAAQSIFGSSFRITRQRGRVLSSDEAPWVMATYHPSALLRVPDETTRAKMEEEFLHDIELVAQELRRREKDRSEI